MTDAARRLLVRAGDEAANLGHSQIGTEHLLLACIADETFVSAQVLRQLLGDTKPMQRALIAVQRAGSGLGAGHPNLSDESKNAVETAARIAKELQHSSIGTGHILLGALDDLGASWAPVMAALGLDHEDVRDAVAVAHPMSSEGAVAGAEAPSGAEIASLRQDLVELRRLVTALSQRVVSLEQRL